ncbi:MAG: SPASM domain-containing protein [Planctomycetes bacterium]|nr:SPASM domain-containing protein [Planctomycetota bacterium]
MSKVGIVLQCLVDNEELRDGFLLAEYDGATPLETLIARTKEFAIASYDRPEIVLLVSKGNENVITDEFAEKHGVRRFVKRTRSFVEAFRGIAREFGFDHVVRIIANNPLVDFDITSEWLSEHIQSESDYTYGVGFPQGLVPSEIVKTKAFFSQRALEDEVAHSRNITPSIKRDSDLAVRHILAPKEIYSYATVQLTVNSDVKLRKLMPYREARNALKSLPNLDELNVPINMTLFIINEYCNLRCIQCVIDFPDKLEYISIEKAREIFDQLPGLGRVTYGGGEPTLAPSYPDIAKEVALRGGDGYLITNGTAMARKNIDATVDYVTEIQWSMDGATKATYDFIRKGAKFERVLGNLDNLIKEWRSREAPHLRKIVPWFVYMESNYREMPEFVRIMAERGLTDIVFSSVFDQEYKNGTKGILIEHPQDCEESKEEAKREAERLGVNISFPFSTGKMEWRDCGAYQKQIAIYHDGSVSSCCMLKHDYFGNLFQKSVKEIWNDPKQQEFRYRLFSNNPNEDCQKACTYLFTNNAWELGRSPQTQNVPEA